MAPKHSLDTPISSLSAVKRTRTINTMSKQTPDTPTSNSSSVKRARTPSTTTTTTSSLVKKSYRANFSRLCTLHNWTPSPTLRPKLSHLLSLSGPRLHAAELLPLAFVQHYPFIFLKGFLLLGYTSANESVWYKAFPSTRGIARGHYYNSKEENILGKNTVKTYWQSWVDVFEIEQRGLDRRHEYFTGVYLILQKFANLRYRCCKDRPRDPGSARRVTGIAEFPFNDEHAFMQEQLVGSNDGERDKPEDEAENEAEDEAEDSPQDAQKDEESDTDTDYSDIDTSTIIIKQERTTSLDNEAPPTLTPKQPDPPTPTLPEILSLPRRNSQTYKDFTLRIPIDAPRWSTTNFEFAVVKTIETAPENR